MTNSDSVYTELMKPFFTILLLCTWLALSAWSQTSPTQPLSQVQQYLSLTDSQVNAILQNNNDYNNLASQQQQQILDAQTQIAIEISKDSRGPDDDWQPLRRDRNDLPWIA